MASPPEVNTRYGKIRGIMMKSDEGINYCAYKGVPFAAIPTGELRFKDPVPPKPWTGVADCTNFKDDCAQFDFVTQTALGSDDCLNLNIYARTINKNLRRPVMFYLHGGGFFSGTANDSLYGADYFMRKDIVLVVTGYRVGIFGFLDLQHPVAPGNQGMKDQVFALEWVKDNIANFGGDPGNVTIFGESAGGCAVHYLTISPLTKGLFHKAIIQSGAASQTWASVAGDPKPIVYKICKSLGKDTKDPNEIVKLLRSVEPSKLIELTEEHGSADFQQSIATTFAPGVDDKSPRPFMPIPIEQAAKQGAHVPLIIGHTIRETGLFVTEFEKATDPETATKAFEKSIHPKMKESLKKYNLSLDDLKKLYFEDGIIREDNLLSQVDLMSDMIFVFHMHKAIKAQVQHSTAPTYYFVLTWDGGFSILKEFNKKKYEGPAHLDDVQYLFRRRLVESFGAFPLKDPDNHRVMTQMIELWTNFARTGNPTYETSELLPVRWLPVNDTSVFRYLHIGKDLRMAARLSILETYSYKRGQQQ